MNKHTYKCLRLTSDLVEYAFESSTRQRVFENSHRMEDANLVGCIGEIAFETLLFNFGIEYQDCRHGTKCDYRVGGYTVDVKTKDRTVVPRLSFENSVPVYNHEHQRPDYYYFVSLLRDTSIDEKSPNRFTHAYLLGGLDIASLDREGKRWEPGQTDPSNGTKFWTACINVKMTQQHSNDIMLELFKSGHI
jgi:hypothetical protein